MIKLLVNNIECAADVRIHDTSVTGIRYKLVVTLNKRLPRRRQYCGPITMHMPKPKPRKDVIGLYVLDIGNALYRQLGFKYGLNPDIAFAKGVTYFTYHFNDYDQAIALGFTEDQDKPWVKRHQDQMQIEGNPAFSSPYLYK